MSDGLLPSAKEILKASYLLNPEGLMTKYKVKTRPNFHWYWCDEVDWRAKILPPARDYWSEE
ncbi:MAG: hypothetical protein WA183_20640 [Chthoniobacterales bacterium]